MPEKNKQEENKHILIVEDSEGIRSFLRILLQSEGYTVHQATNANEALDMVRSEQVDMITLDLGLPDMDGLDMLQILKRDKPQIPVVVISVRNDYVTKSNAFGFGASYYLTKPVEIGDVLEAIQSGLHTS